MNINIVLNYITIFIEPYLRYYLFRWRQPVKRNRYVCVKHVTRVQFYQIFLLCMAVFR